MSNHSFFALVLTLAACGASTTSQPAPQTVAKTAPHGLQIKLATIYVDDQEKALKFYTGVMGFAKKDDVENTGYRWLTVEDTGGGALLLAANNNPAGKAYQQALFAQHQPAVMLFTDDVEADYERIKAKGATFTMPPTPVTGSIIATLDDGVGNLVQLTQLLR